MNNLSKKMIALTAFLLLTAKVKAQAHPQIDEDKVNSIVTEIIERAQSQPELLNQIITLKKSELEESLDTKLTTDEFVAIQSLLTQLSNDGVTVQPTPSGKIVIATQEYSAK